MWIGQDMFYDTIAAAGLRIRETIMEAIAVRILNRVSQVARFLVAKCLSVSDEKLKVACVRLIDVWVVNLLDDPVTEREANTATRMVGYTHAFFRTRSPAWLDYRRPNPH